MVAAAVVPTLLNPALLNPALLNPALLNPGLLAFFTDFADQAVILPLLLAVGIVLAWQRRWRLLVGWFLAVPAVLGAILVLKTMCYACLWLLPWLGPGGWGLRSPSGHAASATALYGCLAVLLLYRRPGLALVQGLCAALGAAVLVGSTRVLLDAHTPADVAAATLVAMGGVTLFVLLHALLDDRPATAATRWPLVLASVLVLLVFHGLHLSAENTIAEAARGWWRHLIVTACLPGA